MLEPIYLAFEQTRFNRHDDRYYKDVAAISKRLWVDRGIERGEYNGLYYVRYATLSRFLDQIDLGRYLHVYSYNFTSWLEDTFNLLDRLKEQVCPDYELPGPLHDANTDQEDKVEKTL